MTDTTVTTETPTQTSPPLPNDPAARSPTGEILEPQATSTNSGSSNPETPPAPTSTESKPEDKPPAPKEGVPEKYADFKLPEGYTLDAKVVEAFTPIARELGLSQDAAQKLVDFHAQQMIAAAKGPEETYASMRSEWQAKVKSDPDLAKAVNGDKTGLDAVKLDIGRALASLNDAALVSEFKDAMNLTGVGDHPAFIKAFWKLSQHIVEGKHVSGSGPSPHGQTDPSRGAPRTGANALYPNLP